MKEKINFQLREGDEFIPLISLLKITYIAESGSEAQKMVESGKVLRNGSIELRKRAKIKSGEEIEYNNVIINIQ